MNHVIKKREVLTLEEVARYLRLPKDTIVRQAAQGAIPGRQIEDTWRFLKAAIDDWLRSYDSRTLLLQQAGPDRRRVITFPIHVFTPLGVARLAAASIYHSETLKRRVPRLRCIMSPGCRSRRPFSQWCIFARLGVWSQGQRVYHW